MRLDPKELENLLVHQAGSLAQKRLAKGLRLNATEATALLASQTLELVREGHSVSELMQKGREMLGVHQVLPGVPDLVQEVQVEGTFPDGTKLVTLHEPICRLEGDLKLALHGSFLPVPSVQAFRLPSPFPCHTLHNETEYAVASPGEMKPKPEQPGEAGGEETETAIVLNEGRRRVRLEVTSTCDRPIQVGSHFPFLETNRNLTFDRRQSLGMRLDIPAGTAVRFEPGQTRHVNLVEMGGNKVVAGGNFLTDGVAVEARADEIMGRVVSLAFGHKEAPAGEIPAPCKIGREIYLRTFGPTTGDLVRLGDTSLVVCVERDFSVYGDECKFGGGKTLREGMGQMAGCPPSRALDVLVTNALVIDSVAGIVKGDVGIKDGKIVKIGKAGNPDVMEGVDDELLFGATTEVIAGEGMILTAGAIDTHVHFICPQLIEQALAAGITTLVGGGTGPATGTCATTCTPGPSHIEAMLKALDSFPMNFGLTGKGNSSRSGDKLAEDLVAMIDAGCIGLKLHEDWGTTPAAIDSCLRVAEAHDVQVTIHTDTLNESCCVEDTIAAFKGRTIHTYHSEGAGGGHAPDILTVCGEAAVVPSSTNPTRPFTVNTVDEHLDMLMVCHHLDKNLKEDLAFAESRIRGETIAAEDVLHDLGAISIVSSDSQAMGRIGEVITRTWQTADKMKRQRGHLKPSVEAAPGVTEEKEKEKQGDEPESRKAKGSRKSRGGVRGAGASSSSSSSAPTLIRESDLDHASFDASDVDNFRVKRYIAKYTVNPARAHGLSHLIGSVEPGKLADLCLWKPSLFGVKPQLVIKSGQIVYAQMGLPNASIPTPQPVKMRPMFGAFGAAVSSNSVTFVSKSSLSAGRGRPGQA
eukprot:Cvel_29591.t1-p1 / transcript=Cvel_29591.t1 / gene=Cvel_29591 / organism=Chromera_velia_CCMP2878 / gene_product=Urease, putative / transcript_product=Urease, putative / location=Cvel_scaffold4077:1-5203(-) / protein_length=863 / sequence_SO=supercontig / SO=protein_coding / is_pseudo=false